MTRFTEGFLNRTKSCGAVPALVLATVLGAGFAQLSAAQDDRGLKGSLASPPALAKLTASDGALQYFVGNSVAVSGNTVVATGGPGAYVWVKPSSGWTDMTETAHLTFSDGDPNDYVAAIAISGDVIVVGTPQGYPFSGSGAAYVYVKPSTGWADMTETAKLTNSDTAWFDEFGYSVALTGNTIVVGASGAWDTRSTTPGAAYVFVKPATGWTGATETAKLTASDGILGGFLGSSVAVHGNVIAAGALQGWPTYRPGRVYMFVKPPTGWISSTETAELTSSDGTSGDFMGCSVSLSGNTVAAGAWESVFGTDTYGGAVYVYVAPPTGWVSSTETAKLRETKERHTTLGYSVALEGKRLLAGAPSVEYGDLVDASYLYVEPAGGWQTSSHFRFMLESGDGQSGIWFGMGVALSGNTVVIGAQGDVINGVDEVGAVFVY